MEAELSQHCHRDVEPIDCRRYVEIVIRPGRCDKLARAHRPRSLGAPALEKQRK